MGDEAQSPVEPADAYIRIRRNVYLATEGIALASSAFWRVLTGAQRTVLMVCNLAIVFIVVSAVIMRYALELDFYGSEEILMIFAHWLYFIGAAHGSLENSHVEADFIQDWLAGTKTAGVLAYARDIIEICVLLVLTYWAFLFVSFAVERWPVSSGWGIPLLVPQSAVFAGFVLMTLHTLRRFWLKNSGGAN